MEELRKTAITLSVWPVSVRLATFETFNIPRAIDGMIASAGLCTLCKFEQPLPPHYRNPPIIVPVASARYKLTVQQIVSKFNVGSLEVYDFKSQVRNENPMVKS
jgi:hypothetical protein